LNGRLSTEKKKPNVLAGMEKEKEKEKGGSDGPLQWSARATCTPFVFDVVRPGPGGPLEEELQACLVVVVVVVVTCQMRTALSSPHDANKVGSVGHHLHLWLPHKTGGEHVRHPRVYR
jgi:hypothetical protein